MNDGTHNYQFDPEGRIKCMDAGANCASPAASYVYSVEGRRVKRTASGTTTWYAHDGGSVLSEFSNPAQGSGTWRKDYIYLNGTLLATESATDGTRFHFSDHLGTPRVITDATGSVLSRHDYYPYGMELTPWTDGETHKFTGKERDTESGLDFFIARFYSSQYGRFMTPDEHVPVLMNPQSLNRYSYVVNNPVRLIDPDGNFPTEAHTKWSAGALSQLGFSNAEGVSRNVNGVVDRQFFLFNSIHSMSGWGSYQDVRSELLSGATDKSHGAARAVVSLVLGFHLVQDKESHMEAGVKGMLQHFLKYGFGDADPNSSAGDKAKSQTQKFLEDFKNLLVVTYGEEGAKQFLENMQRASSELTPEKAKEVVNDIYWDFRRKQIQLSPGIYDRKNCGGMNKFEAQCP